jgi:hypothetical protein
MTDAKREVHEMSRSLAVAQNMLSFILILSAIAITGWTFIRQEFINLPGKTVEAVAQGLDKVMDEVAKVVAPRPVTVEELEPLIIQRMERVCRYMNTYVGSYTFEGSVTDPRWWILKDGSCSLWMNLQGTVYASLDLNNMTVSSITIDDCSGLTTAHFNIELAHAAIADRGCELHPDLVNFDIEEEAMGSDDQRRAVSALWTQAQCEARNALTQEAIDDGLLQRTESNFQADIESLVRSLGLQADVTLVFTNGGQERTPAESHEESLPAKSSR